ncbi:MAG TPA: DNA-binding protein [Alphaproteobacteria bacterium]|nr:DNA-binding protein [Alphaproteobacteria bacterium]
MHKNIFNKLELLDIKYENYSHEQVFTVAEADSIDSSIDTQATKNLFVKDKKKNFYLITLQADKTINLKSVAKQIEAKGNSLSFASPDDLKLMLNLTPGSVTPFGLLYAQENGFNIKFFLDEDVYNAPTLGIHPMRNDMTTVLSNKSLEKLLNSVNIDCNLINF